MPAFMKLGDVKGEATDDGHKDWIIIESMGASIHRTVPEGAKDQQRTKGHTVLSDVSIVRQLDKSSVKLLENCANGTFFDEVEIHFCTTVKNKQEPYLKYKLKNAIISGFSQHAVESGNPLPSEEFTMNFVSVEWTYITVDPKTGDQKGNVPGKYDPGAGKS
jgi:type VI secretion system secreted protein Hcp